MNSPKFLATSCSEKDIHQKRSSQKVAKNIKVVYYVISTISSSVSRLSENLQTLGKKYPGRKRTFLDTFSSDNWDKLNEKENSHCLFDCQGCLRSANLRDVLSMFKSVSNSHKRKAKKNSLVESMALKHRTKDILNNFNKEYRVKYKTTFTEQVNKILHTIHDRTKIASSIKEDVESQLEETCFKR